MKKIDPAIMDVCKAEIHERAENLNHSGHSMSSVRQALNATVIAEVRSYLIHPRPKQVRVLRQILEAYVEGLMDMLVILEG